MFTIQRPSFILHDLTKFWKKYFPKKLHESLYSCGICVSSIWTIVALLYRILIDIYFEGYMYYIMLLPVIIIAAGGVCAIIDRAVKYLEYGYKYNPVEPNVTYSYLQQFNFRLNMFIQFLYEIDEQTIIVEIGGATDKLKDQFKNRYYSYDKINGEDINQHCINGDYFVLIQGLLFEGHIDHLLTLLKNSKGFIIEGSLSGQSKQQLQHIIDAFPDMIKMQYTTANADKKAIPEHCAGQINNRIVLVKRYLFHR